MGSFNVNLKGRGLRGESYADVLRRTGQFGVLPTDTDEEVIGKLNADAAASAALAESVAGPTYPGTTEGLSDTVDGQAFAVDNGDGTVTIYLNSAGVAVAQRTLATTGYLASPNGAAGVGYKLNAVGATERRQNEKNEETASILDFHTPVAADHTSALQAAIDSGVGAILIPKGEYIIDSVVGANIYIYGPGTLRKKSATKGVMLDLTGDNRLEGVTLDYDWSNADQSKPYYSNILVQQIGGSLSCAGVWFRRSFNTAIYCLGGSLTTDAACRWTEGAPHNDLAGGDERTTHYIRCGADAATSDQVISINGGVFIGTSLDPALLHLNPTGIFITSDGVDGARFKTINISNAVLLGCSTNAQGNVTGAIDTYNGAENIAITGVTVRYYTYSGIKLQNSSNFSVMGCTIVDGAVPAGSGVPHAVPIHATEKQRGSTVEQKNGRISLNVLGGATYCGIINSCDNTIISQNIITGVTKETLGTAIENTGHHVKITGNIGQNIAGIAIHSEADYCTIEENDMSSGAAASDGGIFFTGVGVKLRGNRLHSGTLSGGSAIRTNGPASRLFICDNDIEGFPYGIDIRTTSGTVSDVAVGLNKFTGVTISDYNFSGATNLSRQMATLPPVTDTFDPPSLSAGSGTTPVRTVACVGAATGDAVHGAGVRDMAGIQVVAWVSAADTISYFLQNPAGNPAGTVDLGNTLFRFVVTKTT